MNKIKKNILRTLIGFSFIGMILGFYEIVQVVIESKNNGFIFTNDIDLMDQFVFGLLVMVAFGWVALIGFFIEIKLKLVA